MDYQVGQLVLKLVPTADKMDQRAEGPYHIHSVHVNGNVTIRHTNNLLERLNIRRIKPFKTLDLCLCWRRVLDPRSDCNVDPRCNSQAR
jgi:hypothetical protein